MCYPFENLRFFMDAKENGTVLTCVALSHSCVTFYWTLRVTYVICADVIEVFLYITNELTLTCL